MKRTQRHLVLRLINALFPHKPTIPPRKSIVAHRRLRADELSDTAKRKPKEPTP